MANIVFAAMRAMCLERASVSRTNGNLGGLPNQAEIGSPALCKVFCKAGRTELASRDDGKATPGNDVLPWQEGEFVEVRDSGEF